MAARSSALRNRSSIRGVRFSVEPGSRLPSYTAANSVIRRSRLASSLSICRNARF